MIIKINLNNDKQFQNGNKYNCLSFPSATSFKMNMKELKGIDKYVAKKQKINPQSFKTMEAFQTHCKKWTQNIADTDFFGRRPETQIQRKDIILDWFRYITKEDVAYPGSVALMIMTAITNSLKPKEDSLPPVLNKGVLADTIIQMQKELSNLKPNEEAQYNFDKEYKLNLQKNILSEEKTLDANLNGWIIIPSKENDLENFEANLDKLKIFSHDSWCTKGFKAEPYLQKGNFHIYMENGKPKLGIRFIGDKIQEIQGELNNSKIPVKYEDVIKEHIKDYEISEDIDKALKKLERIKKKIKEIKSKFPEGIENASTQNILEALGIRCKKDNDGLLIISHYGDKKSDYTYSDLGIDVNSLFKDIKIINGNANFNDLQLTDLGHLQSIGGKAVFGSNKVLKEKWVKLIKNKIAESFPEGVNNAPTKSILKIFGIKSRKDSDGLLAISHYRVNSDKLDYAFSDFEIDENKLFKDIKAIEGDASFYNSQLTDLGNLQHIGGHAFFKSSKITDLGGLKSIGGNAYLGGSSITNLGKLKTIGGYALVYDTPLSKKDFGSVKVKKGFIG